MSPAASARTTTAATVLLGTALALFIVALAGGYATRQLGTDLLGLGICVSNVPSLIISRADRRRRPPSRLARLVVAGAVPFAVLTGLAAVAMFLAGPGDDAGSAPRWSVVCVLAGYGLTVAAFLLGVLNRRRATASPG
jgi:hypothetical protein